MTRILLYCALVGCLILLFFIGKEIVGSWYYSYQAKIITETGDCLINYEELKDNCLLIRKSSCDWSWNTPRIYCGKFILENLEK